MKLICNYLTNGRRCKLNGKDQHTGLFNLCYFRNGPHPNTLNLKLLKKRKEFLYKAKLLCKDLHLCKCKNNNKKEFSKIADAVQKEIRKINKKIEKLEKIK